MPEYININEDEISKPIYRIIGFDSLVGIFQSKQMAFVKPEKWDDPFENLIAKTKIYMGSTFIDVGIRETPHGTCWTRRSVSDAIWRIYSHDKKSVRIKSTPAILCRNITKGLKGYPKSKLFIGKVEYLKTNEIRGKAKEFTKGVISGDPDRVVAQSLLFKRNSFSHEEEVRVLVIDHDNISMDGVLNINVDPHEIIQNVQIDSRAPSEIVEVYTNYLKNVLHFNGYVGKSTLYDVPKPMTVKVKTTMKTTMKTKMKKKIKIKYK
jgi:hypothetical protein